MGVYRVAQVCLNGHVATRAADEHPQFKETHCSQCGEITIMSCQSCKAPIRGEYDVQGVVSIGFEYHPPAFCHNCGSSFPWTERKIASAVELVGISTDFSDQEIEQFRNDLNDLAKDTPRSPVASFRFKQVMSKVSKSVSSGVKDIVINLISEQAKRNIWGP